MKTEIIKLYQEGLSAKEIKKQLNLSLSIRTIQRYLKARGVIRGRMDALKLSYPKRKFSYVTKLGKRKNIPDALRYRVLARDGFKCVLCGADATTTQLQPDHINEDRTDTREDNLQTLCRECNQGKSWFHRKEESVSEKN